MSTGKRYKDWQDRKGEIAKRPGRLLLQITRGVAWQTCLKTLQPNDRRGL